MNTIEYNFKGLQNGMVVKIPLLIRKDWTPPIQSISKYTGYCGHGKGYWEEKIPDTLWNINISVACAIHDDMFEYAASTWRDFHYSNSVFIHNLSVLHSAQVKNRFKYYLLLPIILTYYLTVDSPFGANIFWKIKNKQAKDRVRKRITR